MSNAGLLAFVAVLTPLMLSLALFPGRARAQDAAVLAETAGTLESLRAKLDRKQIELDALNQEVEISQDKYAVGLITIRELDLVKARRDVVASEYDALASESKTLARQSGD